MNLTAAQWKPGFQEQKRMKCFICNQAETVAGTTSVLFERGHLSLTINNVPARICPSCGEAYADESVAAELVTARRSNWCMAGTKVECRGGCIADGEQGEQKRILVFIWMRVHVWSKSQQTIPGGS